jgi:hypothetical protein
VLRQPSAHTEACTRVSKRSLRLEAKRCDRAIGLAHGSAVRLRLHDDIMPAGETARSNV